MKIVGEISRSDTIHSFFDIVCHLSDTLFHSGYIVFFNIGLSTVIHVPQGLKVPVSLQMALPGVSVSSVVKALQRVDRTDFGSLLSFIEMLEASLATQREKGRVLPCASLKLREVFKLFGFSNDFIDIGPRRDYQIPEMRINLSTPGAHLKSCDHELLKSISIVWPPANKSNVRLFVSMMIHFAIEQINSETEAQSTENSESLSVPKTPAFSSTPPKPSVHKSLPVILKAYTEAMVSWETTDSAKKKIIVKRFIDYGISYAQKTPESLESFFTIVETKGADEMNDKSWAQLLAYIGMYSSCAIVHH